MDNEFDNNIQEETHSIKDYFNLIRINIIPILLIGLTGLAVSVIYAFTARDIYTASTALKIQKPQAGGILSSPLLPEISDFGNDRFIANEIEILKSRRLRDIIASALIDSFNTVNNPDSFYVLLDHSFDLEDNGVKLKSKYDLMEMLDKVKIEQKRGLDIVEISVESPVPYEAQMIANCYAQSYEKLNLKYTRQQLSKVVAFLQKQRTKKYQELLVVEEKMKKFQVEGRIIALDDQAKALIDILSTFEAQRDATSLELSQAEENIKQYKEEMNKQNSSISKYIENYATEPRMRALQEEIARLEMERDVAMSDTTMSATRKELLVNKNRTIRDLRKQLNEQLKIYKESIYAASPAELKELSLKLLTEEVRYKSLQATYQNLNKIIDNYESKFNELPNRTIGFARYQRELNAYEKLYLLIEEKYQEALISEQSTPGNVLIIDEAQRPVKPSKPNRKLIVVIGLILGFGFGVGFAFVRDYFDNTVKTPEDIEKENINVLTWIPKIEGVETNKEFEFIIHEKSDSIYSEAFRVLRTRIQFSKLNNGGVKVIHITSSTPQEGKTTIAINVAGSFAQTNKRTIIVDCDLRKPRVHTVFKEQRFPGFTDYFLGHTDLESVIHKSKLPNLDFITCGTIPPNPSEILGSQQMVDLLARLKTKYDLIVLDSPPIIAVTDSEILSRIADTTILVAASGETEIELLKKSAELLQHDSDSFIGVVLNKFTFKSGYGSYYKYYYYYSNNKDAKKKKFFSKKT
ncbi:Tyrosine-protein kinase [hydrothermal vent metagenome]|uniref:non-specific protein-tyrosine kinase n=1 Tax=hydrothermal vent metagenome TaxID=652676 RepID=A0A3B1C7A9_9ZZZZ